ncbi:hypothetical protein [Prauserella muralis]|uniref:Uncharacterized protein n=1 Tax=Prauserella muralis TaxID=588067 RepID=A0A2V4AMJ7_9PSEU|nr:hypothetical protein [Prauserella muralis]PXY20839.1 hypothetical protein BAY60_25380 [Prauserella muralis]TWE29875.1 hypothetical protein FHX69_2567 [Prauserella muralis]
MSEWAFDVGVSSHELLREGVTVGQWVRVEVAAESYLEAAEVAIQMAGVVGYATDCLYVE